MYGKAKHEEEHHGKAHVRKGDTVVVLSGKDRGKQGKVLRVNAGKGTAIVERVNFQKKHTRPNPQKNIKGGIVEREAPIHASNVMLVDPDTNEPTRVGTKVLPDGRRVRIARKSGTTVDK